MKSFLEVIRTRSATNISDAILDATLRRTRKSRVAVEIAGGKGIIFITRGRSPLALPVDAAAVAKRVMKDVGYDPRPLLSD